MVSHDGFATPSRRDEILAVAVEMFREQGFRNTTNEMIAAELGMTGPSIYRHFAKKDDILIAAFERVSSRLAVGVKAAAGLDAETALETLLASHVDVAVGERSLLSVYIQEERSLPRDYQRITRNVLRDYTNEWAMVVGRLRPELSYALARVLVQSALSAVHAAVMYDQTLTEPELRIVSERLAKAVLFADLDSSR